MRDRLLTALLLILCAAVAPAAHAGQSGVISEVDDGDTVKVTLDSGRLETIRLIGIDTPEVYFGAECGGAQASATMEAYEGVRVSLTRDRTQANRDRYGRLLRYVNLEGGADLGRRQIAVGLAAVYVYDGVPFKRVRKYRKSARRAKRNGLGVWATCGGDFHKEL